MKKLFLLVLVLFGCVQLQAQTAKRMDKTVFKRQVLNQAWMAVSGEQKEDHEDLFFKVTSDSIALAYINWIEGGGAIKCTYRLELVQDNIFELKIEKCDEESTLTYIYGYMPQSGELSILVPDERLKISKGMLTRSDWIRLDLVKE